VDIAQNELAMRFGHAAERATCDAGAVVKNASTVSILMFFLTADG